MAARFDSKERPMLVGDVLCAITGTGYCWRLSGGSQLSSAVTRFSKNDHVFRESSLRYFNCSSFSFPFCTAYCGRLIRHAVSGAVVHAITNAIAQTRDDGEYLVINKKAPSAMATDG